MDDNVVQHEDNNELTGCKNCNNPNIESGYRIDLCSECRDKLSNRAIPKEIKVFFGIIILIMIVAIAKFPNSIKAAIEFERGVKAEEDRKYITAMNEYRKVLNKYPDSTLPIAKLTIAMYKNGRFEETIKMMDKLYGKEMDNEIILELNFIMGDITSIYYPNEELVKIMNEYSGDYKSEKLLESLKIYVDENQDDVGGKYYLANTLFEFGEYKEAEKLLIDAIKIKHNSYFSKLLLIAVYREQKQYEKALEYCNKLLDLNRENQYVYVAMSRIELKRYNDKLALDLAKKAYKLDENDTYAASNLSLVYHYNDMIQERDEMLKFVKNKNDEREIDFLVSIFDGTNKWRE